MTALQALRYFAREALVGLVRSWKVSLLAIATIAVSLVLLGGVLLVTGNAARLVGEWQAQARVVVYLRLQASEAELAAARALASAPAWIGGTTEVSASAAAERFRRHFTSLGDLLDSAGPGGLPPSLELVVAPEARASSGFSDWLAELRAKPAVLLVDDDLDWLAEAERLLAVVRSLGVALSGLLLCAAVFTIGSVIRLVSLLHREEIAVLRLVGATEFFLRGPFLMEGLLHGVGGGLLALGLLWLGRAAGLEATGLVGVGVQALLGREFLAPLAQLGLVGLGAGAGVVGAALSLTRDALPGSP